MVSSDSISSYKIRDLHRLDRCCTFVTTVQSRTGENLLKCHAMPYYNMTCCMVRTRPASLPACFVPSTSTSYSISILLLPIITTVSTCSNWISLIIRLTRFIREFIQISHHTSILLLYKHGSILPDPVFMVMATANRTALILMSIVHAITCAEWLAVNIELRDSTICDKRLERSKTCLVVAGLPLDGSRKLW